jgi:hypothetical protein
MERSQVSENEQLTGVSRSVPSSYHAEEKPSLLDGAWSAKQPHGEQEERSDEAQDPVDSDAQDAKGQSQQPHDRIKHQGQQRDGPAKDEQNAPKKEGSHGNLASEAYAQAASRAHA